MYLETLTPFSPRRDPRSSATLWTIWRAWEVKTRMGILMFVAAQTWNTTCIPSHDRLWVSTHTTFLALSLGQVRSPLCLLVLFTFDDTHWTSLVVCVSGRNVSHAHPLFHGLRNPIHTVHVQMIFLHATAWRSNPIPTKLFQATDHTFGHKLLLLYLYSP